MPLEKIFPTPITAIEVFLKLLRQRKKSIDGENARKGQMHLFAFLK